MYITKLDKIKDNLNFLFDLNIKKEKLLNWLYYLNFVGLENTYRKSLNQIEFEILYNRKDWNCLQGICLEIYRLYCFMENKDFKLESFIYQVNNNFNDIDKDFFGPFYDHTSKQIYTFVNSEKLNKIYNKLNLQLIKINATKTYCITNKQHLKLFKKLDYERLGIILNKEKITIPLFFERFINNDYYYLLEDLFRFTHLISNQTKNKNIQIKQNEDKVFYKILLIEKLTTLQCFQIFSKSFIDKRLHKFLNLQEYINIQNETMDNFKYLRRNIFEGMYDSMLHFDNTKIGVFEIGKVFYSKNNNNDIFEEERLGVLWNINNLSKILKFNNLLNKILGNQNYKITKWKKYNNNKIFSHYKQINIKNNINVILNLLSTEVVKNLRTDLKNYFFIFFEISINNLILNQEYNEKFNSFKIKWSTKHRNIIDMQDFYALINNDPEYLKIKDMFKNKVTIETLKEKIN